LWRQRHRGFESHALRSDLAKLVLTWECAAYFTPCSPCVDDALADSRAEAGSSISGIYGPKQAAFDKTWKPGDYEPQA